MAGVSTYFIRIRPPFLNNRIWIPELWFSLGVVYLFLLFDFSLKPLNNGNQGGFILEGERNSIDDKRNSLDIVHVLFVSDSNFECTPLPNLINSILLNTKSTIQFHISLCNIPTEKILSCLKCYFIPNLQLDTVKFYDFNKTLLQELPLIGKYGALPRTTQRHYGLSESCGVWSRFFIPKILPNVERVVYLDTDVIVQGDIADLDRAASVLNTPLVVTKPFNFVANISGFPSNVRHTFESRHHIQFNASSPAYITGVLVMNLDLWRQNYDIIVENINFWMNVAVHSAIRTTASAFWWEVPDQSLTYLAFYLFTSYIPKPNVQCDSLSWVSIPLESVSNCLILHWNGAGKPWLMSGRRGYSNFWRKYSPVECSGDGRCTVVNASSYTCINIFVRTALGIYL